MVKVTKPINNSQGTAKQRRARRPEFQKEGLNSSLKKGTNLNSSIDTDEEMMLSKNLEGGLSDFENETGSVCIITQDSDDVTIKNGDSVVGTVPFKELYFAAGRSKEEVIEKLKKAGSLDSSKNPEIESRIPATSLDKGDIFVYQTADGNHILRVDSVPEIEDDQVTFFASELSEGDEKSTGSIVLEPSDEVDIVDMSEFNSSLNSGCHGKRKLNSARWDWDDWNKYGVDADPSADLINAVATELGVEPASAKNQIVKVLKMNPDTATGKSMIDSGIVGLIFLEDPAEDFEEIWGWTGSDINRNSSYNLGDLEVPDNEFSENSSDFSYDTYYNRITDEQVGEHTGTSVSEVQEWNEEIERYGYGKVVGHYLAKPEYEEALSDAGIDLLDILEDGTVGYGMGHSYGTRFYSVEPEEVLRAVGGELDSSKRSMNCSADTEQKITTESGNEISMSDIKIVQNPETNELALYIPENDEDTIPDGYVIIGNVVPGGAEVDEVESEEHSDDDQADENGEGAEELDSSKKSVNSSKLNRAARRRAKKAERSKKKN